MASGGHVGYQNNKTDDEPTQSYAIWIVFLMNIFLFHKI